MVSALQEIDFAMEIKPDFKGWPKGYIALTDDEGAMMAYLTDKRLKALIKLFSMQHVWGILAFRGEVAFLRLDMPQALDRLEDLEAMMKRVIAVAKVLEIDAA